MSISSAQEVTLKKGPTFVWGAGKKTNPEMMARALRALSMSLRIGGNEAVALEATGYHFSKYTVGRDFQSAAKLMQDEGAAFGQAMLAQDSFPRTVRELILATPTSSGMHKSLVQAAKIVQDAQSVKKKLLTSMIQPGFMLGLSLVLLYVASAFIIPGILESFSMLSAEPPASSLVVLAVAEVVTVVMVVVIASVVLFSLFWGLYGRKQPKVRAVMDRFLNKVPIISEILRLSTTSRLFLILSANLSTGRSEPQSLESAAAGCGSDALHQHAQNHVIKMREEGARLRDFAETNLVPANARYMLASAPSIRQEIDIMTELAPEYQSEADQQLDTFSKTIEPIMNYIVYAVAGTLIISIIIPMYSIFPALMDMAE